MSLELALAANTAAITELTGAWKQLMASAAAIKASETVTVVKAAGVPVIEKTVAPKPVTTPAATPIAAEVAVTASPEPVKESLFDEPGITYEDVSKAVLAKMKTDKPAVMAAAAKFAVKNAKELKPEQWADFIKEIA